MFFQLKHAKQTQEAIMMSERKQEEIAKDKLDKVASFIPSGKIDEEESQDVEEVSHEEETVHQEAKPISEEDSPRVETSEKKVVEICPEVAETDASKVQTPLDGNQQDINVDKESSLEVEVEVDKVVSKVEEIKVTDENLGTEEETKKPVAKDEGEIIDEDLKKDDSNQDAEAAAVSVSEENVENDSKDKLVERSLTEEMEENDNAAGDVGLPDAHRIEDGKTLPTLKQEHMGEEEIRESVSDELLESINRNKRLSTETDDSSDAYTDVLVEDEEEEEEEECLSEMTADAGKGETLNVDYVHLNEESPMDLDGKMRKHIHHGSEEDMESKHQEKLNAEDSTQIGMSVSVYELSTVFIFSIFCFLYFRLCL